MVLVLRLFLFIVLFAFSVVPVSKGNAPDKGSSLLIPRIGVAKSAAAPILQPNGTYNVTYTVTLKNYGSEILYNVNVLHLILTEYVLALDAHLVGNIVATGSLIPNNDFGLLSFNLLAANSKLFVGEQQTIVYTINVNPNPPTFGPFLNTVEAIGFSSLLVPAIDISVNGLNPDPNGDGSPIELGDTPVTLTPVPSIGVAKSAAVPIHQLDGTEHVTYTVTLKNLGNAALTNVQVVDNLSLSIIAPASFAMVGTPIATGTLVANSSFNGSTNQNLLANASTLAIGQQGTITFTIKITPNGLFGPFLNNAAASASSVAGPTADLFSVNGNDPDPNGDRLPLEASATSVTLVPAPIIGVAKSASSPQLQADNSYNINYTITLENLGNEELRNVQVTDVLNSVFVAPTVYAVVSAPVASGTLIAKVGYDGGLTNNLLNTGSTLAVGATQTITFTVNVKPNGVLGPFLNNAQATATGVLIPVIDVSVDGTNPDPNSDGLPLEAFPTISLLTPVPLIGVAKSASAPIRQSDNTYNVTFTITVENLGNEHLTDVKVTDVLASAFVGVTGYTVVGPVVASGSLVAKAGFDGSVTTDLLAPGSTLSVGASQTITFTTNINSGGSIGPFLNTAIASAKGSLLPTTDISVDGNDPDPNGDGLPLETFPTGISLIPVPIIGISKTASTPSLQPNGSYNVTFTLKVENLGNEPLNNVQVTDAMISAFIAPSVFSIVGGVVTSGTLLANAGFDGQANTQLLAPGSTLGIGASQTITFTTNLQANGLFGPFLNTAIATANGALLPTTDISVDGNDPDPNGDGLPLETLPTIVSLVPFPLIGISKSATTPLPQTDGSYLVTFNIKLKNMGNELLTNVQVTDALASIFGTSVYSLVGGVVTSGTLVANVGFNGNGVSNLLAAGSTLSVGATQNISFTVRLRPDTFFGPFINLAVASATGSLLPVTDISVDGNEPDPNGDGLPLETSPTAVLLVPIPVIGLAKSASSPLRQPDGSYNITYTFTLKNLGNVMLENVQITDAMATVFTDLSSFSILGSTVASGTLLANPTFDGDLSTNLLTSGSTLAVGATQQVTVTINAVPNVVLGPFINTAIATATGGLLPTMDISMDGNDPDPNGDGLPLETLPTIVLLTPNPVIGVAKNITSTILQADGSYNISYEITVKNYGNVALHNIVLTDDLASIFGLAANISLVGGVSTTGGLAANVGFDGELELNLLDDALSTLPIGASERIAYTINVDAGGTFPPFCNAALALATGPLGVGLTLDFSHSGTNPDPDGDGNPNETGENECSPVSLTPNPVIGVAKAATAPALQANGSYNVTYSIFVKNLGNSVLTDVQVSDDLLVTFPSPVVASIVGNVSATGALASNTNFNGKTDKNLLAAGSQLAIGASGTINFTLNIVPGGNFGPFYNTAVASGKSGLLITTDISTSGTDPDPNHNGNPSDPGESNATTFSLAPHGVIGLAKSASTPLLQVNDGSYNVSFTFTVANLGNVALENVQLTENLSAVFPSPVIATKVGTITSPGTLVPNSAFNGTSDINLLAAGSTLAVGATEYVTLMVNIQPIGNNFGPFFNTATASAKEVGSAATTTDVSTDGNNTDPNGNRNPSDAGENNPTSISLVPHPVVGLAMTAGSPTLQANGSYNVPFTLTVSNLGNVLLNDVQVTDALSTIVVSPSTYTVISGPATTGSLIANGAFNGNGNVNLLAAGSSLAVGATGNVTLTLNIVPNSFFGPFSNTATATATGAASSGNTTDVSCNGTNPDPNGNGNPGDSGENGATVFSLTPFPSLGVALSVTTPLLQSNGTYRATYTALIRNLGNTPFSNLQCDLNLAGTFSAPATFALSGQPSASGSVIVNTSYNGTGDIGLLASGQTLAIGATETISIPVIITPSGSFGPFFASAVASGTTSTGSTYSDISAAGTNPDANGNGNAGDSGENDPTPLSLTPNPIIGAAKSSSTVLQPDGSYKINFVITVKNMGNVDMTAVQVIDNLQVAFPLPASYSISGPVTATGTLSANPNFNGNSDIQLLSSGTLAVGSTQQVAFSILLDGNGHLGPYYNHAFASGTAGSVTYNDISTSGNDPDPNHNGIPNDPGEDAATSISLSPSLVVGVSKSVSLVLVQPDGSYRVTYLINVKNLGNTAVNKIQVTDYLNTAFPAPATFNVLNGSPVTTGQLIANPKFNGKDTVELLSAGSKLAIGADHTISLTVEVDLNGGPGIFYNSATSIVTSDDNLTSYSDISVPGNDPDPNHNGNPGDAGENDPTSVTLTPKALLGVAMSAGIPRKQTDGSFIVIYTVTLVNMGNVPLRDPQVLVDLLAAFPSPASFSVSNIQSTTGLQTNETFNGGTNKNLLGIGNILGVGATMSANFTVQLNPGTSEGPFLTSAVGHATGAGGTGFTSDVSTNGTDPDPNGNGFPGDPGEDSATPLSLDLYPIIGAAKSVSPPVLNTNDNTYDVTYTITLENLGDLPLSNVALYDNISIAFPAPAVYTIKGLPSATGSLHASATYDGNTQFNILNPTSTLAIGEKESITFVVNVLAPPADLIYYNSAVAAGTNGSLTYTDISTVGNDPDPNNNGDPNDANENIPTPVILKVQPTIGLANHASTPQLNPDGTYDVEITITIENLGNESLQNVDLLNNLSNTFPSPMEFRLVGAPTGIGTLTVNPNYNGKTILDLIISGTLAVGASEVVKFTVNITPNDLFGVFWNTSWTIGIGINSSNATSDTSNNGLNSDPNNTGAPDHFSLNTATPIQLRPQELIGVATLVGTIAPQSSCVYDVPVVIALENFGNATLTDIAVTQDLSAITATGATYAIESVVSDKTDVAINSSFNGASDKNLLAASAQLGPDETVMITILLRITPNLNYGPYLIITDAFGTGAENSVSDSSVDGTDPDPDQNDNPIEESDTQIAISPVNMAIPQGFSPNGDGENDVFVVVLECGVTADLRIFNRWGDEVYYDANYSNEFDGTSNGGPFLGKPLPEGTYFYTLLLNTGDKVTNFITLKR